MPEREPRASESRPTISVSSIWHLPLRPAVYALYGTGVNEPPVFIGVADNLRRRAVEQLVVLPGRATSPSSLSLRANWIGELRWWAHPSFEDRHQLRAAELVASDLFDPFLRSRVEIREPARRIYEDADRHSELSALFSRPPTGTLTLPTLSTLIERLDALETRLQDLATQLLTKSSLAREDR